ncbi:MAG: amidohydrolase [Acidobacteria bacterium]|nr:amidohydrolase [Acidobacteriota bacterium]
MVRFRPLVALLVLVNVGFPAFGARIDEILDRLSPTLDSLYLELHRNPEISYHEEKTSARIAGELKLAGFTVTDHFGKYADPLLTAYGVVGVLKNGDGPTVMVRTDLDALPLEEKTGLPYASTVHTKDDVGMEVSVMHACGHDIHMSVFVGVARALAEMKGQWKGTLILLGQPAEEIAPGGAEAMLAAGLYQKFGKPDFALALHDNASLATGMVGWVEGYTFAAVDTVDITVRGAGGHGAYPHTTKDPVVIAAETVVALQTIVSREVPPGKMAVVTVGSIHGGTKHNIIPDEVKLQLTVRTYDPDVRKMVLASIERIAKGIAMAAGVPPGKEPIVSLNPEKFLPAEYNNPALVRRIVPVFESALGAANVKGMEPVGGAEDFALYTLPDHSVPLFQFWLGAVDPKKVAESEATKVPLPSLHSSLYAPVYAATIRTGVKAMTAAVMELMRK